MLHLSDLVIEVAVTPIIPPVAPFVTLDSLVVGGTICLGKKVRSRPQISLPFLAFSLSFSAAPLPFVAVPLPSIAVSLPFSD